MDMSLYKMTYLAGKILISLLICLALPIRAQAAGANSATSMVTDMPGARDGKSVLESLLGRFQTMKSYRFDSSLTCYSKARPVTETGSFYFKNPHLVRFEARSAGALSGSIVVRQSDGKVRAKSGGFFGLTLGLAPNSKLLMTPNGYNILQSDFATLIESVLKSLDGNLKCLVTGSPVAYPGLNSAYILEVMQDPAAVLQRIALDSENKMPLEWTLFNNDRLFSVLRIQKLSASPVLPDDLFSLDSGDGAKSLESKLTRVRSASLESDDELDIAALKETKLVIQEVKRQCDSLSQEVPALLLAVKSAPATHQAAASRKKKGNWQNPSAINLSAFRHSLLVRTATIESIVASLTKLEKKLQNLESQLQSQEQNGNIAGSNNNEKQQKCIAELTHQWHQNLVAMDACTAKLYEMIESEKPDIKSVVGEAKSMRIHSQALDSIVDKLTSEI